MFLCCFWLFCTRSYSFASVLTVTSPDFFIRAGRLPERGAPLIGENTLPRFAFKSWCAVLACAAGLVAGSVGVTARAETALNAKTSWIGNTFGFGEGTWAQINITAIAVAPDGKVYTNAPWDESGAEASVYQDGKMLGFAGGTHGWGNSGGNAIALNRQYAFVAIAVGNEKGRLVEQGVWPQKGKQWFGISRRLIADPKRAAPFQPAAKRRPACAARRGLP